MRPSRRRSQSLQTISQTSQVNFSHTFSAEKKIFQKKTRDQKRQVPDPLHQWHILSHHINIIRGGQRSLPLVVPGAAGGTSVMDYLSSRFIIIAIPVDPGAIAYIQILQISKMFLVKVPDLDRKSVV